MATDDKVVIGQTHAADDAEAVLIGYCSESRHSYSDGAPLTSAPCTHSAASRPWVFTQTRSLDIQLLIGKCSRRNDQFPSSVQ